MTRPRMVYRPVRARQRVLLPGGGSAEGGCVAVEGALGCGKKNLAPLVAESVQTLTDRIAHRDRPFERAIEPAYLERLRGEYEGFFDAYDETALLTLNTDEVDIFTESDLKEILRYVDEAAAS